MAPHKVLMLTNSERGQANVFIATAHALLERDPTIEIHVASFGRLEKTLRDALVNDGAKGPVTFHALSGRPQFECYSSHPDPNFRMFAVSLRKPGIHSTPHTIRFIMAWAFLCWEADEFVTIFNEICAVIEAIQPDIVLVDGLFAPGLTAAKHMKSHVQKPFTFSILSPNTLKDYIHHHEPRGAQLWKWPVVGSGLTMPIPLSQVPLNAYLFLRLIGIVVGDKHTPTITAKIREIANMPELDVFSNFDLLTSGLRDIDRVIVSSRPEVDFPALDIASVPKDYMDKICGCGPILRPLEHVDDELSGWLKQGPVVYINLGTHCLTSEAEAIDMAKSLKTLLDKADSEKEKASGLQILWKLQKDVSRSGEYSIGPESAVHKVLGEEMDLDRVRIVDWLSSEPSSILETGDVICAVSHGGANSFYEAVCTGVPQVILPSWLDCYDFANRAELLGIGRWGSKKGCPRWIESELTSVLIDVVLDKNAEYMAKARSLAEVCGRNGGGRSAAADEVLRLLGD
ncbi:hypothetical protein NM208_g1497 [Fusarium decemcellulare]|uniref:Uncharacterized protein n=1 Tax=Fusarium decemcellulare TaxID=57161 RepID=A0ACC1SVN2_9HYPO|nr:hypothetical protein NM208_g1497 [Fusarium decemcellulare]